MFWRHPFNKILIISAVSESQCCQIYQETLNILVRRRCNSQSHHRSGHRHCHHSPHETRHCWAEIQRQFHLSCLRFIVQKFLHGLLSWSLWKATQAAQKLPKDWEDQCEWSFFHKAYAIKEEDIPAKLYVNSDQMQLVYATCLCTRKPNDMGPDRLEASGCCWNGREVSLHTACLCCCQWDHRSIPSNFPG